MAVLYKSIQSTMPNKAGEKLFHARVVYVSNVGLTKLADEVAELSSLSPGDVKNTITNLVTVMTRHMQSSESVTLEGLGTFSLAMRSRGQGAATAEEVDASKSYLHVRFRPASTRNSDKTVATRSLVTGVKCVPYSSLVSGTDTTSGGTESGGTEGGDTEGGDNTNPLG